VTCIRLDATVTPAHSDKELAEPNFKGFGHHPLLSYCDNTDEPLAGIMRAGSDLALGRCHRRRLGHDHRAAAGPLTTTKPSQRPPKEHNEGARGTPARPARRAAVIPGT
jgi:hypothetical protein